MKRKSFSKRLLKLVPLPTVVLVAGLLVGAVLLGTIFSLYSGNQAGNIEVEGIDSAIIWDGVPVTMESWAIPLDEFSESKLVAGEVETFTHTLEVTNSFIPPDGYNALLSFDYSSMDSIFTDPDDPHYGYYLEILDDSDTSIKDEETLILSGSAPFTIKIVHELDSDFIDTDELLPFDLEVLISGAPNCAPIGAVLTGYAWSFDSVNVFDIPTICDDENINAIDITSVSLSSDTSGQCSVQIIGTYPNEEIELTTGHAASDPIVIDFTVEDEYGLSGSGSITGLC